MTLIRPNARYRSWRARWVDPDTGRTIEKVLPATVTTFEARRAWAIDLSKKLVARRVELEAGAHTLQPEAISAAVDSYLRSATGELRARTVAGYKATAKGFQAWAAKAGIAKTTELTRGKVGAYRDWVISTPRLAPAKGGKRGERARTAKRRTPRSINRVLTETHTMLIHWLDRDLLRLSAHELKRGLRPIPGAEHRIVFYDRKQIAKLPLAEPFVRFVLLSGMRLGEALTLEWKQVVDGELHVTAESKTRKARTVDLTICPTIPIPDRPDPAVGRVWSAWTEARANAFAKANGFSWQTLRRTCSTYLTCSAIYGAATPWHAAKRAGHSLAVAESRYAGLVRVPPDVTTLEAAMGVE